MGTFIKIGLDSAEKGDSFKKQNTKSYPFVPEIQTVVYSKFINNRELMFERVILSI